MNNDFPFLVRRALDESTERVPYRISQRLAASREAALGGLPAVRIRESRQALTLALSGADRAVLYGDPGPAWRLAGVLLPLLIVICGMVTIALWDDDQKAAELADVDADVLTDDVPISAYTDRGFGVFLSNQNRR
jgi:hypothetical protein